MKYINNLRIATIISMIGMSINAFNDNISLTILFGVLSIICVLLLLKENE